MVVLEIGCMYLVLESVHVLFVWLQRLLNVPIIYLVCIEKCVHKEMCNIPSNLPKVHKAENVYVNKESFFDGMYKIVLET